MGGLDHNQEVLASEKNKALKKMGLSLEVRDYKLNEFGLFQFQKPISNKFAISYTDTQSRIILPQSQFSSHL